MDEFPSLKALVGNTWTVKNLLRLKLPAGDIVGNRSAEELAKPGIVSISIIASPTPHTDNSVQHIEICRQIEPEVCIRDIVRRGWAPFAVDLPITGPVPFIINRCREASKHIAVCRPQPKHGSALRLVRDIPHTE